MSESTEFVAAVLRVHGPFHDHEVRDLVAHWSKLDHRLRSFDDRAVTLDLHLHDRDGADQHVVLEATIGGLAPIVATARSRDLPTALNRVRDELVRRLSDAKQRTEPRNNRHLRRP
ncbi:MAG: HPF/RaiA family ribosome-associated protein [Ilumatobacteraceae bacterium]